MAGSKSGPCPEIAPETASRRLEHTLSAFLAARLLPGERLCVGLSGGRDSVVLLHALDRLRARGRVGSLAAIHVDHGLSANAGTWAGFCAEFCRQLGVPLDIVHVEVPRDDGEGLEAAARRARHRVFAGCCADWLALAHHQDDQVETVLFRLLRGAGVAGAAGMPAERSQAGGPRLIRPLLDVPRALIAGYAAENSLVWVEDESNADCRYRRNHLRQAVLPRIEEAFPAAARTLARAAGHFAEAAALLDELAQADRATVVGAGGRIDLLRFNALPPARARNLLRRELSAAGWRAPEARWLDEALRQLTSAGSDSQTCIATPDGEVHVYRHQLYVCARRPPLPAAVISWLGEARLAWGDLWVSFVPTVGAGVSRGLLAGTRVCLRRRQGGERLQIDARRPRRTLANLLQEAGVPPWERARLPLLWSDDRLVWVGGIGIDASFACRKGEAGIVVAWENVAPCSAANGTAAG